MIKRIPKSKHSENKQMIMLTNILIHIKYQLIIKYYIRRNYNKWQNDEWNGRQVHFDKCYDNTYVFSNNNNDNYYYSLLLLPLPSLPPVICSPNNVNN